MKKRKLLGALLCSVCLIAGNIVPASADAMRVVTLGADLTDAQKQTMMNYFKVSAGEVEVIYITNEDERAHLSAYVPLEQIGTKTVSCAYVRPTQSGGIKVRTANLNWVTGNMIASTLSTSGVKNCEVIAACPFEVSGTGALTGIQMAYERASGETLDPVKKEIATEEMVVTGNLADEVGKVDATTIITQAKIQVIESGVQSWDEIYNIVANIASTNGVSISNDEMERIVALLVEIAEQNYEYEDMRETLERVDENVTGEDVVVEEVYDEDSIMTDIDETILGEDILATSTDDATLEEETGSDSYDDSSEWVEEVGTDEDYTAEGSDDMASDVVEDKVDPSQVLSEQAYAMYRQIEKFCAGQYEGDAEALIEVMGEGAYPEYELPAEVGAKLSNMIKEKYLDILMNGTSDFVADGTEAYMNAELNVMNNKLKEIFTIDGNMLVEEEDVLIDYTQEEKDILYKSVLKFFEKVYGEDTMVEIVEEPMMEETYYTEEGSSDVYEESTEYVEEEYYE